jgi:hypothetical protein
MASLLSCWFVVADHRPAIRFMCSGRAVACIETFGADAPPTTRAPAVSR